MSEELILIHHGIKGQKWGVRRYQNKDGSLTGAGKRRYNVDEHKTVSDAPNKLVSKAGQSVELQTIPSSRITNFLAAHNRHIRTTAENTRNFQIKADGKVVGDLQLYKESKDSLNVVWVGVNKSERGHGYATAAVLGSIEIARRSGCRYVTLEVPGNSPDARHVYEKLGFVAQEQITSDDDVWGGLTSMKLDLGGQRDNLKHSVLVHHGIEGQKWGVRNGPPYPLGADDKSAAEKKAASSYRSRKDAAEQSDQFWTDGRKAKAKKVAKGVAITAAVVLAVYGGYKLSQTSVSDSGETLVDGLLSDYGSSSLARIGKLADQVDTSMVSSVNHGNTGREGEINCAHTSMAYICNSLFGMNVVAQGFSGVDEASGMVTNGRSKKIFDVAFDGIKHIEPPRDGALTKSLSQLAPGSTGILRVRVKGGGGHFINYEKAIDGSVTLIDCQQRDSRTQIVPQTSRVFSFLSSMYTVTDMMDFSNATVGDKADEVFRYCVK